MPAATSPLVRLQALSQPASNGCRVWTGSADRDGYGQMWFCGRSERAHRVAWMLAFGPIPDGAQVCHHCDNPPCVNPNHLFCGSNLDNVRDRSSKGRSNRINSAPFKCKVTAADVAAIREGGRPASAWAETVGVSPKTIQKIRRGETWKHVGAAS